MDKDDPSWTFASAVFEGVVGSVTFLRLTRIHPDSLAGLGLGVAFLACQKDYHAINLIHQGHPIPKVACEEMFVGKSDATTSLGYTSNYSAKNRVSKPKFKSSLFTPFLVYHSLSTLLFTVRTVFRVLVFLVTHIFLQQQGCVFLEFVSVPKAYFCV